MDGTPEPVLDCPRCRAVLVREDGQDRWYCPACHGDLLGAEEVEAERLRSVTMTRAGTTKRKEIDCPKCSRPMQAMAIGRETVDCCVHDGTIWFDGGDLERVREVIRTSSKGSEDW